MGSVTSQANWISEQFGVAKHNGKSVFTISGVSIEDIVKKVPPPFYVYDAATIRNQYKSFHAAVSSQGIEIYYSVKPNSSLAVVDGLRSLGAGLEIASLGELEIVKKLQADPKKVSFAGPVKTTEELEGAIAYGIDTINVESEHEFYRINDIANKLGKKQRVGIRVNPIKEVKGGGVIMGGGPKKFGIDVELLTEDFIKKILALPNISLEGVHVYAATQILDLQTFVEHLRSICEIAEKLNQFFQIKYVNFGGGFGIPYTQEQKELPVNEIAKKLGHMLKDFPFLKKNNTRLFVEPGRFLVGTSGIYVTKVDHVKTSRGLMHVMVDGGWHHMSRPSPDMPFSAHPIYNLSCIKEPMQITYDIAGSLCTPIDLLGKKVLLPSTKAGDLLGIFNAGAYGRGASPLEFLSHGTPAEVLVGNRKFEVIRKAEHPREFLKNQSVPKENMFERSSV
jgi:diaminopimelate decarboxylase